MSPGGVESSNAARPSILPHWLLRARVIPPPPPPDYVPPAPLLRRIDGVLERRLTVLQSPGGFGKTTALADVSHRKKRKGVVAAWLSLDQDDNADVFGHYLARAFEHAGLNLAEIGNEDAWSSSPFMQRLGMLARAIELHVDPCLLVLDEVDLLPPGTVESVGLLLKGSPRNLHIAVAFRSNPGLDLAPGLLDGSAIILKAPQFRLSRPDIARFFDEALSRRQLVAVEERTAGWPVALMVDRNMRAAGAKPPGRDIAGLSENYVGVRLLRGLSNQDRQFLFNLAVFDWIDADIVDEVLGSSDARLRVSTLPSLDGLRLPVDRNDVEWRLHPLVREYCATRFAVEDPVRKRLLHTRIARALARRGHRGLAWRHATAAGDDRLVGELIENVGAFGLWLREGLSGLAAAGRFLTSEITALYPRLALLRCIELQLASRYEEASALYETVALETDGFTRDRRGGDPEALTVDRVLTQAVLAGGTCRSLHGALDSLLPADAETRCSGERRRFLSSARHLLRCISCCHRAEFEESRRNGLEVRARFADDMRYGDLVASIYLGMVDMVQGRVQGAIEWYKRARRATRDFFPSDPRLATSNEVLAMELDLERNRVKAIQQRKLQGFTELRGVWNEIYAVAVAVRAELAFEQFDGRAAIQFLDRTVEDVRRMGARSLETYVSALLALYLVRIGRTEEAAQVWKDHALPCETSELLDLDDQSWRRMEALSCARVALLVEQDDLQAAEALASALCATAAERGMTRTAMRALGLSVTVAHRAGREDRALSRLVEFLRLVSRVDYVRPLVSQGETTRTLLRRLPGPSLDVNLQRAAEAVLSHFGEPSCSRSQEFTSRELDVLAEVRRGHRNKVIASTLGITDGGVRYHLKNIYRKTGVSRRLDAVRYAEEKGILG